MKKLWFLTPLIITNLLISLAATPAHASRLMAPAVDGDGLMAVSPTSITYGATTDLFTFTFTANNDFGAGSQVDITIPSGWTPPTTAAGAGHVSWYAGTCVLSGAPPVAITGMDIFIDMAGCTTGHSFTVTYANALPGKVPGSPYTFLTQTDIGVGGQGLVPITAGSPTVSINPKPLTVSAAGLTPASKVYDASTTAVLSIGTPTLVGIVGTDQVTLDTLGAAGAFVNPNTGTAKLVNISGLALAGFGINIWLGGGTPEEIPLARLVAFNERARLHHLLGAEPEAFAGVLVAPLQLPEDRACGNTPRCEPDRAPCDWRGGT